MSRPTAQTRQKTSAQIQLEAERKSAKKRARTATTDLAARAGLGAGETQPKRSKYGNIRVERHGMWFDSKWEADAYDLLLLLEKAGQIRDVQRQVPFALHVNGHRIGRFTLDFTYVDLRRPDHPTRYVDTKSPGTEGETIFRWKVKHVAAEYGAEIETVTRTQRGML